MSVYAREISRLGGLGRSHELVVDLVPPGSVVLDVGCASGYVARALLDRGAQAVDGIELDPVDAEAARAVCRTVVVGSVEDPATIERVADGAYDAIVLADVVEHLRHPEEALRALVPKLRSGGRIVLSVPNVAHWSVRLGLLRGRFRYEDVGLLDRTHLRFFTRETAPRAPRRRRVAARARGADLPRAARARGRRTDRRRRAAARMGLRSASAPFRGPPRLPVRRLRLGAGVVRH